MLRGQSLVEMALVLPILMLLLVMALDFGRVFFGWVALTNAARVGANYAASHPENMDATTYADLITGDADAINCAMASPSPPAFTRRDDGSVTTEPALGDYATVELDCAFDLITPLAGTVLGTSVIDLTATSTFPVRYGCAGCPPPSPAPPPTPPQQCRTIPGLVGMSVAGARLAWESAGFSPTSFAPLSGLDTATVSAQTTTEDDPETCTDPGQAIFLSSVLVSTEPADPVTAGVCETVPNLIGMTVGDGRTVWEAAFAGTTFTPSDQDDLVVTGQATDPTASTPGVTCIPLDSNMTVTVGPAWASPPPAPCKVPNLIDKNKDQAAPLWMAAGFDTTRITYDGNGNFKIKSQSLVGGDWVDCGSSIVVSN